ncbi:MAG: SagB/ThcOx family dehydrogenase [Bacteroidales bacterium]|nr:SagB/ThcOx family dehydrogenase [Bacteroidales bacterium]
MKLKFFIAFPLLLISTMSAKCQSMQNNTREIVLPLPRKTGNMSVEEALFKRRSIRHYKNDSLTLEEVSQILWAAYGVTEGRKKTCPSAGATYPLVIYLLAGEVQSLHTGLYRYDPYTHSIKLLIQKDLRKSLTEASLQQDYILHAPASIIIAADFQKTMRYYGQRGERYVYMEVGHCGQNIHLQCEALQMGTVVIGAFDDADVKKLLQIKEEPMYIMPIGRKP